jgi:hypothetical protein
MARNKARRHRDLYFLVTRLIWVRQRQQTLDQYGI